MKEEEIRELIRKALFMREFSYVPYSGFRVGAAVRTKCGRIFGGCNIENAAFGSTVCAERTAIFKAISEGFREFSGIAIVGAPDGEEPSEICPPCGACRQVMSEFAESGFQVILAVSETDYRVYPIDRILPLRFELENETNGEMK